MTSTASVASVLVVDDTPANLALLFETLTQAGHRLLVAESGADALAVLSHSPVDLILLDVVMPGIDGFETCARIKANPAWADLPVLFMTSIDTPADKVRAFGAGAEDYIVKPVYPPEVLARVAAHLRLRALARELAARNADLESEVELRLDAEAQLARSLDRAVLVLGRDGTLLFGTQLAHDLLAKFSATPVALLHTDRFAFADGALLVRRFTEPGRNDLVMMVLEEEHTPPGPAALLALGLTPRQAEVAYWVAQGKTNPEIAVILGASSRTIDKHMERILARLGVENRASLIVASGEYLRPAK